MLFIGNKSFYTMVALLLTKPPTFSSPYPPVPVPEQDRVRGGARNFRARAADFPVISQGCAKPADSTRKVGITTSTPEDIFVFCTYLSYLDIRYFPQEHPVVSPHASHFKQVPFRRI